MGVGRPEDLLEAVSRGIDLFDCVMPTRNGRNAMAFTSVGKVRLRNEQYKRDESPLDAECECPEGAVACRVTVGSNDHGTGTNVSVFRKDLVADPALVSPNVVELADPLPGNELSDLLLVRRGF